MLEALITPFRARRLVNLEFVVGIKAFFKLLWLIQLLVCTTCVL